jgi:hypothetical protein
MYIFKATRGYVVSDANSYSNYYQQLAEKESMLFIFSYYTKIWEIIMSIAVQ